VISVIEKERKKERRKKGDASLLEEKGEEKVMKRGRVPLIRA
jgi:hypothetical protein